MRSATVRAATVRVAGPCPIPEGSMDEGSMDTACIGDVSQTPGLTIRDLLLRLRVVLSQGTSFAIATVVEASGPAVRRPGTVLVLTGSGETMGFSPAGPLDGAIRDLAAEVLATGHPRLERLEIDADAASYIGLSGTVKLAVHAMRVEAGDPAAHRALRHLDSGAADLVLGTSGWAVVGRTGSH
jgi:xanthine/CO dehydrogenase XdhC/CoxF family maturation factor